MKSFHIESNIYGYYRVKLDTKIEFKLKLSIQHTNKWSHAVSSRLISLGKIKVVYVFTAESI